MLINIALTLLLLLHAWLINSIMDKEKIWNMNQFLYKMVYKELETQLLYGLMTLFPRQEIKKLEQKMRAHLCHKLKLEITQHTTK